MQNELQSSKNWYKRGKTYQAKTMEALKTLYAETEAVKPGHDPKGLQPDATSETVHKKTKK